MFLAAKKDYTAYRYRVKGRKSRDENRENRESWNPVKITATELGMKRAVSCPKFTRAHLTRPIWYNMDYHEHNLLSYQ